MNRDSSSGKIIVETLVAFNVILLLSGGYFGASLYLLYKMDTVSRDEKNQIIVNLQQRQIQNLQDDIKGLRNDLGIEKNTSTQQATALEKKIDEAQTKSAALEAQQKAATAQTQQKLTELEKGVISAKTYDIAKIISEWRPRIAYIECDWKNTNGFVYQTRSGSGIVTMEKNGSPSIITNTHIVVDQSGVLTTQCRIKLPDSSIINTVSASQISKSAGGYDWSRIDIGSLSPHINEVATNNFAVCADTPSVGTNVVIIGYPGIGSQTDITATEGIISGYDSNYYITSAKVEQGNSGGAAIDLKKNCYLGIPTFARTGGLESLARILSSKLIFPVQ